MKFPIIAVALGVLSLMSPAQAQDFPNRAIRLVVPFAAGGVVDISGRMIAESLATQLGQPVVVENLPGGFGMIAAEQVARSAPDGYTLLIDAQGVAMNPGLRDAPYDPNTDLEPVGQIMNMPVTLGVNPGLGIGSYDDFIAYAKANPGALNAASSGTSSQLAAALLGLEAGIEFEVISYQGAAPAATAVVNGEADFIVLDLANLSQHLLSGGVTGLMHTGDARVDSFPDIPTSAEVGLDSYDIKSWFAIFRPEGVPADVTAILEEAFANAASSEAMTAFIAERSANPSSLTQAEFSEAFSAEVELWARVVDEAGIEAE